MEQISDSEKNIISEFLEKTYVLNPSKQVNLESRGVKSVKCVNEGSYSTIAVANTKIQSAKDWLVSEGFTLIPNRSPFGYKVFLTDEYAPL